MATPQPPNQRIYLSSTLGGKVHHDMQEAHRVIEDSVFDLQDAVRAMRGGPTAVPMIDTGVIVQVLVGYPAFGLTKAPVVAFVDPGGGTGAAAAAVVQSGRLLRIIVTAGGAGYTAATQVVIAERS